MRQGCLTFAERGALIDSSTLLIAGRSDQSPSFGVCHGRVGVGGGTHWPTGRPQGGAVLLVGLGEPSGIWILHELTSRPSTLRHGRPTSPAVGLDSADINLEASRDALGTPVAASCGAQTRARVAGPESGRSRVTGQTGP